MKNDYFQDPYVQTMISNMPEKTGKSLEEWFTLLKSNKFEQHSEIMNLLKKDLGLTHGYANTISLLFRQKLAGGAPSDEALLEAQYAKKSDLLPIYDRLVQEVKTFGDDVVIAPKKSYVSLRRARQFAIIQPSTKTRMDLGLNLDQDLSGSRILIPSDRWNGMCTHHIEIYDLEDITLEVLEWLKKAYNRAV
jgi:predicted transport protein